MKDQLRQAKSKGPSESYSKFRVRWRHVLVIDQQVRAGRAPNCRRLAEELEVSRRTVLRDVDFMRYDLSAPIEYENLGKSGDTMSAGINRHGVGNERVLRGRR